MRDGRPAAPNLTLRGTSIWRKRIRTVTAKLSVKLALAYQRPIGSKPGNDVVSPSYLDSGRAREDHLDAHRWP
jgi:hypothetical protein